MVTKPKVDYPAEVENAYEELVESESVVLSEKLSGDERSLAQILSIYPTTITVSAETLDRLQRLGVASELEDGGLVRGPNWNRLCNV